MGLKERTTDGEVGTYLNFIEPHRFIKSIYIDSKIKNLTIISGTSS